MMEKPIEVSILNQRLSNVYIDGVDSVALTHIVKMVEETANHLQETRHINSTHLKILYTAVYFAAQMYLQNKKVEEQKKQNDKVVEEMINRLSDSLNTSLLK